MESLLKKFGALECLYLSALYFYGVFSPVKSFSGIDVVISGDEENVQFGPCRSMKSNREGVGGKRKRVSVVVVWNV